MGCRSTRELLDLVRDFHKQLSELYARMAEVATKEKVKMLLNYMSRHETQLEQCLARYEEHAAKSLLVISLISSEVHLEDDMNKYANHYFWTTILIVSLSLLLIACSSPEVYSSQPLPDSVIYMADGIENEKIQMIWLEVPKSPGVGETYVRLFFAKHDPPEPTIPHPNNFRCLLKSDDEFAILGPEKVPLEFMEDGIFTGSYTYRACPDCIECYMNWDYTLEMNGSISDETVLLDIAVVHFGHNVQGSYVSTELTLAENANKEPRIKCNRLIECKGAKFVNVK